MFFFLPYSQLQATKKDAVSSLSLPAALPGYVSWRALHREASQGRHGEVQEAAGGDHQRHQDEERGEEPALLQHVPRQDSKQRRCVKSGRYPTSPSWWFPDAEMTELSHQIKQRQDFDLIMGCFPHISGYDIKIMLITDLSFAS